MWPMSQAPRALLGRTTGRDRLGSYTVDMRIEHSIDIAAPVARVWELTLDIESWPEHVPTMTSIRRLDDGPLTVGSRAEVKQPGQRARVWTVTELEAKRVFAWSADALGTTMTGTHRLTATESGTTNT